jgi:phage shock protein A
MGPSLYNRVGPTMITFVAPLVESHASPRSLAEPAVRMEQVTNAIKAALDDQEVQGFAKSATGIKMEAIGMSTTATGLETFVKGLAAGVTALKDKTTALENHTATAKMQQKAVELDVEALEAKTGLDLASLKLAANSVCM